MELTEEQRTLLEEIISGDLTNVILNRGLCNQPYATFNNIPIYEWPDAFGEIAYPINGLLKYYENKMKKQLWVGENLKRRQALAKWILENYS